MKNRSVFTCLSSALFCCFFITSINLSFSQEQDIYEVTVNDLNNKSSKQAKNNKESDRSEFYNLSQNLHTVEYYHNNKLSNKHGNETLVKINIEDIQSLNVLFQNKGKFKNVKLITIVLNSQSDFNTLLDLSEIKDFSELKYLYIKCNFNCNEQDLKRFIKTSNSENKVRIFYTIVSPS